MIGLHMGVISLVGRFVGARDMTRVDEIMTAAFTVALAYGVLLATLSYVGSLQLVDDDALVDLSGPVDTLTGPSFGDTCTGSVRTG